MWAQSRTFALGNRSRATPVRILFSLKGDSDWLQGGKQCQHNAGDCRIVCNLGPG